MPKIFPIIISSLLFLFLLACDEHKTSPVSPSKKAALTSKATTPLQKELDILEAQLGNSNRTIWQQPKVIIEKLGDLSDKVIVDIGAGPFGYFSFQLASEAKKVIAVDIDPDALNFIDSTRTAVLPESKQASLETRLATPNNPNLKPNEADIIILVNIYAYLPNPMNYLKILKTGLSQDGKILIVDFKMRKLPIGPTQRDKVPLYIVEQNLEEAGFNLNLVDDRTLDYQYMVLATNIIK